MKRLLPSAGELALFALVAMVCAAIVSRFAAMEIGLAVVGMMLFVAVCGWGLVKNGHFPRREVVRIEAEANEK